MGFGAVALRARFDSDVVFHQKDLGAQMEECWQ